MLSRRNLAALFASGCVLALIDSARAEEETWPLNASSTEIQAALAVMHQWMAAYQAGDYREQWRLTDSRIRRWFDRRRWGRGMERARRADGALLSYRIASYAAASAADLPCTEMGHCFREQVLYVIALVETRYEIASPPQPEFIVVARSDEGWRFGGGTILNRPLGETAVIMTTQDERRYEPSYTINR